MPWIVTQHPNISLAIAVALGMLLIAKLIAPRQNPWPSYPTDDKSVARGIELDLGRD